MRASASLRRSSRSQILRPMREEGKGGCSDGGSQVCVAVVSTSHSFLVSSPTQCSFYQALPIRMAPNNPHSQPYIALPDFAPPYSALPRPAVELCVSGGDACVDCGAASEPMDAKQLMQQTARAAAYTLEAGIMFHSLFVGISLGTSQEASYVQGLAIALIFHQVGPAVGYSL